MDGSKPLSLLEKSRMPIWKVGANRNLPISLGMTWDGAAALRAIFAWAGGDDFDPAKARQAFLVYDSDAADKRGSYKLPFARPIGGELTAVRGGLRAAASRLPQTDVPDDVKKRARAVIDAYQKKIDDAQSADPNVSRILNGRSFPASYETYDSLSLGEEGTFRQVVPLAETPGFDALLVPWHVLSDRGTFFVPGAAKKTAKERVKVAPHLWQHDTWEPIGKHIKAIEDEKGFWIAVEVNEDTQRGAELMSNLRFGVPLGVSIGIETIRDRSGTDEDNVLLDRSTAPDWWKNVPINELRAVTEFRWWESSSVTFPALAPAKPTEIRSASPMTENLNAIVSAIEDGTLDEEILSQIVAACNARAAAGNDHSTPDKDQARRRIDIELSSLLEGLDLDALEALV